MYGASDTAVAGGEVSTTVALPVALISGRRWALRKLASSGVCGPEVSGREVLEPLLEEGLESNDREDELKKVCVQIGAAGAVLLPRRDESDGRGAAGEGFSCFDEV